MDDGSLLQVSHHGRTGKCNKYCKLAPQRNLRENSLKTKGFNQALSDVIKEINR